MNLAIEKYINKPITSLIVVMNGPVARAGSILYLFKINGTNVPNSAAKTMTESNERLMVIEILGSGYKKTDIKNNKQQHIKPFTNATPNSLINRFDQWDIPKLFAANPCTMIAEDCTPTLPPIAVINGIKKANSGFSSILKRPIICAPINPPSIPIISQGILAFVSVNILSNGSILSLIPDAIW